MFQEGSEERPPPPPKHDPSTIKSHVMRDALKSNSPPRTTSRQPVTLTEMPLADDSQASLPFAIRLHHAEDESDDGASRESGSGSSASRRSDASQELHTPEPEQNLRGSTSSAGLAPLTKTVSYAQTQIRHPSGSIAASQSAEVSAIDHTYRSYSPGSSNLERSVVAESDISDNTAPSEGYTPLQYHHEPQSPKKSLQSYESSSTPSNSVDSPLLSPLGHRPATARQHSVPSLNAPRSTLVRPASAYTLGSDLSARGRSQHSSHLSVGDSSSPASSPGSFARPMSSSRRSPETRPMSYIDLLNTPYAEQVAPQPAIFHNQLRSVVGDNASLLDQRKTLEMYRANVKKTNDPAVQYEFAVYMVNTAKETIAQNPGSSEALKAHGEMISEAKSILQRLADRSYPFAQYYLGDGHASGLFNKGKEDWDRAFPLFVAASKHGHAESGYRAALCYEFGWGCRRDLAKAVQFYRAAASRNHPGAATRLGKACLTGDMGLTGKYREGLKWLKRAAESADTQYNQAPYELGMLHVLGDGVDVFQDEAYAAQLFTQAANLGHAEASFKMGEAYEHGLLNCPRDPALSVHFYNGAAQAGIPEAMMALCAWYMVGAEPVLDKDENEAYEWAKQAAATGLPKAEYAIGYFTEMGIGCRRDPLEANVWYVQAADHGEERAKQRLAIIRAAASGEPGIPESSIGNKKKGKSKKGDGDKEKDCIIM